MFLRAASRQANLEIPLYFLLVKTNVSYACVATFMTQFEDATSVADALQKIKQRLGGVSLNSFMLDCHQGDIDAVKKVFPGAL